MARSGYVLRRKLTSDPDQIDRELAPLAAWDKARVGARSQTIQPPLNMGTIQ